MTCTPSSRTANYLLRDFSITSNATKLYFFAPTLFKLLYQQGQRRSAHGHKSTQLSPTTHLLIATKKMTEFIPGGL